MAGAEGRLRWAWLFSRRVDVAMLALPALVTLGAFALAAGLHQEDGGRALLTAQWLTAFVLGNTTHVILTYLLLGVRRDVLHATERQAAIVLVGSAAVFSVAVTLSRLTHDNLYTRPLLEAATFVLATHHTLSQAKGFWALYGLASARAGLPPPSARERSLQRLFVPFGLLLVAVRWTLVGKRPFTGAPPMMNVNPGDPAILPHAVTWLLLAAWLIYVAALLRALTDYDAVSGPKVMYLLAWSLIVTLDLAAPGWGATMSAGMHGVEYYLLTRRMLRPTASEPAGALGGPAAWLAMIGAMAPILAVGVVRNPFGISIGLGQRVVPWALSIVNGVVLAHYFADAFIYRFRIPSVRKVALARLGFG